MYIHVVHLNVHIEGRMKEASKAVMYCTSTVSCCSILQALSPSSSDQPWYVDPSVLKPAVAAYPTLQAALFPPPPTSLTAAQSQDITVYQLLQARPLLLCSAT